MNIWNTTVTAVPVTDSTRPPMSAARAVRSSWYSRRVSLSSSEVISVSKVSLIQFVVSVM